MAPDVGPGVFPGERPEGPPFLGRESETMTKAHKSPRKRQGQCKPAAGARGKAAASASVGDPSPFSRAWMAGFLEEAGRTGDVHSALAKASVSLVEYRRARRSDPLFHAACADVDSAVRESIRETLELEAARGSVRAAALLARGLGALDAPKTWADSLPPHVAAAMIDAGLKASGLQPPPPEKLLPRLPCPHCGKVS